MSVLSLLLCLASNPLSSDYSPSKQRKKWRRRRAEEEEEEMAQLALEEIDHNEVILKIRQDVRILLMYLSYTWFCSSLVAKRT